MSPAAPSAAQVRAHVEALRQKLPEARVFGIHSPGRWGGQESLLIGGDVLRVHYCESPLEVREAMLEAAEQPAPVVLLTPLTDRDLEADVRARLARGRLIQVRPWDTLRDLLQLRGMDPRLDEEPWMAEVLLELAAGKPIPSGFLDADTAWDLVAEALGLSTGRPDTLELLRWAETAQGVDAYRRAPEALQNGLRRRVAETAGPSGAVVLDSFLLSAGGNPLALGLVCSVVFHPDPPAEARIALERAAVRMERHWGQRAISQAAGRAWARAAETVVEDEIQRVGFADVRPTLVAADAILREVEADEHAWLGRWSLLGFEQRLGRFAAALDAAIAGNPGAVAAAAAEVGAHALAPVQGERVERVEMAVRLVRWLRAASSPPGSFEEAVERYAAEGGFVDAVRASLEAGDGCEALSSAYGRLLQTAGRRRERENEAFGRLLAGWSEAGGSLRAAIPIEKVLATVVAPLSEAAPVLLVVVDGMSQAVYRELARDVAREGWIELAPEGRTGLGPVVAALPTITEVSRASLLCGRLCSGVAADETAGFEANPDLVARTGRKKPPVLFHKADLGDSGDPGLAAKARAEIASPERRVVGLVINAVDDHLAKGDQIRPHWGVEAIRPFRGLLHAAQQAGRVVVLTSDHGHVPEAGTELRAHAEGERWRSDDGAPGAGEVAVAGPRVVRPGARLIAPWSERLRYGVRKNGYHGGVSPQEVVVPLAVFSPGLDVTGWVEVVAPLPSWWAEDAVPPPRPVPTPRRPRAVPAQKTLFEEGVPAAWVDELLRSSTWKAQVQAAGRVALEPARVRQALEALEARGGRLTRQAFAHRLQVPPVRVNGFVAALRRLLNVEGYDVLQVDEASDTLVLNRELLRKQFDLRQS